MLSQDQVVPFLSHADPAVRRIAAQYFDVHRDPRPDIAEAFWDAIEKIGPDDSILLSNLTRLPQTRRSLDRCVAELQNLPRKSTVETDLSRRDWLQSTLGHANVELVSAIDRRTLEAVCDDRTLADIDLRRDIFGMSFEERWQALADVNQRLIVLGEEEEKIGDEFEKDDEPYDPYEDEYAGLLRRSRVLIDAIARDPAGAERATRILDDSVLDDWMEFFSVSIVGKARHEPATVNLMDRLQDVDSDDMASEAAEALGLIGTEEVVRSVVDGMSLQDFSAATLAVDALRAIKSPQAEAALAEMLEGALADERTPAESITCIAGALLDCCPNDVKVLELVRQAIVSGRWDMTFDSLDESLLAVGTMVGYEPPEAAEWRKALTHRADEIRAANQERHPDFAKFVDKLSEYAEMMDDESDDRELGLPPSLSDRLPEVTWPIHRDAPKVGRNDPCPCGSGKKYKKCCLNK